MALCFGILNTAQKLWGRCLALSRVISLGFQSHGHCEPESFLPVQSGTLLQWTNGMDRLRRPQGYPRGQCFALQLGRLCLPLRQAPRTQSQGALQVAKGRTGPMVLNKGLISASVVGNENEKQPRFCALEISMCAYIISPWPTLPYRFILGPARGQNM